MLRGRAKEKFPVGGGPFRKGRAIFWRVWAILLI
jgi:hypothetical protein